MIDFVKGFREVKEDCVYLARLVETVGEVAESSDELGFATSPVAKAVLEVGEDGVGIKKVHNRAMDDVLEKFTTYRRERNRTVVFGFGPVSFFEDRYDMGLAPVLRDGALIKRGLKKKRKNVRKFGGENFEKFTGDSVGSCRFVFIDVLKELQHSLSVDAYVVHLFVRA